MKERYTPKKRKEYNKKAWVQFYQEYERRAIDEYKKNPPIQYLAGKSEDERRIVLDEDNDDPTKTQDDSGKNNEDDIMKKREGEEPAEDPKEQVECVEQDDLGKVIGNRSDGAEEVGGAEEDQDEDFEDEEKEEEEEGEKEKDSECPDGTERLKSIFRQIREYFLYCYPAVRGKTEYFKLPSCPPGDEKDDDDDENLDDDKVDYDTFGEVKSGHVTLDDKSDDEKPDDEKSDETKEPDDKLGGAHLGDGNLDDTKPGDDKADDTKGDGNLDGTKKSGGREVLRSLETDESEENALPSKSVTHEICYEPKFWTTLTTIILFAPILAFTVYHFVNWYKTRCRYKKRAAELKRLKRENHALRAERDRLDAYIMSARMSPLTDKKRRDRANEEAERISHSLDDSNRKLNEMRQDRAILLEVLRNLKAQEENATRQP